MCIIFVHVDFIMLGDSGWMSVNRLYENRRKLNLIELFSRVYFILYYGADVEVEFTHYFFVAQWIRDEWFMDRKIKSERIGTPEPVRPVYRLLALAMIIIIVKTKYRIQWRWVPTHYSRHNKIVLLKTWENNRYIEMWQTNSLKAENNKNKMQRVMEESDEREMRAHKWAPLKNSWKQKQSDFRVYFHISAEACI